MKLLIASILVAISYAQTDVFVVPGYTFLFGECQFSSSVSPVPLTVHANTDPSQCASFCDNDSRCVGTQYQSTRICSLFAETPTDVLRSQGFYCYIRGVTDATNMQFRGNCTIDGIYPDENFDQSLNSVENTNCLQGFAVKTVGGTNLISTKDAQTCYFEYYFQYTCAETLCNSGSYLVTGLNSMAVDWAGCYLESSTNVYERDTTHWLYYIDLGWVLRPMVFPSAATDSFSRASGIIGEYLISFVPIDCTSSICSDWPEVSRMTSCAIFSDLQTYCAKDWFAAYPYCKCSCWNVGIFFDNFQCSASVQHLTTTTTESAGRGGNDADIDGPADQLPIPPGLPGVSSTPTNTPSSSSLPSYCPSISVPSLFPVSSLPSAFPSSELPTSRPSTDRPSSTPSTTLPSHFPTYHPSTIYPTKTPSSAPSFEPSTIHPTRTPSSTPSFEPSTIDPTRTPSSLPTFHPTIVTPTISPSQKPSRQPSTGTPSKTPSQRPSAFPTTAYPTALPSTKPSLSPTFTLPTKSPSASSPSLAPTSAPTDSPVLVIIFHFSKTTN